MAIYVSIDESYAVSKLNGIDAVVKACDGYYTQDGKLITKKIAKEELKGGFMNVYEYDSEEQETARDNGSVLGIDWRLKIQTI